MPSGGRQTFIKDGKAAQSQDLGSAPGSDDWHQLAAIRTKLGPNWVQALSSNELARGERNARAVGLLSVREVARLLGVSTCYEARRMKAQAAK